MRVLCILHLYYLNLFLTVQKKKKKIETLFIYSNGMEKSVPNKKVNRRLKTD